ncbi:MAG: glycosyltransferase family 2 protein [Acutalibacteraceae bacterium]|nr:glycosyltransferase family 2 protein [Acutalibacteraceae bacterium]
MKLSLVVPCYNEEQNVALFYSEVKRVFDAEGYSYECVFVNDGSADNTLGELKKLHAEADGNIRIVSFSRNFGKEAAMYAGIEHAKGELICLIDADLQQRPEVVVGMVKRLDEAPELDCVAAYQAERHESGLLTFFKSNFYKLINSVSDTTFVQGASDFRTFRRSVAEAVLSMGEYHRFSKGILSWVGFNTEYIPYEVHERAAGESKWSFKKLFKYAIDGIMAFSTAPLAIPTVLGIIMAVVSFLYLGIDGLISVISSDFENIRDTLIIFLLLLIGGIQLISIGIIGKYLAKTYEQSKNRPIYIAREVIEPKNDD